MAEGSFVLTKFETKKKTDCFYIGQISEISVDEETNVVCFYVNFLRREEHNSFSFVFPQDLAEIEFEQIVGILPQLIQKGGTARIVRHVAFSVDLSKYSENLR